MTDKECFIIMPITTPQEFISAYKDDCEHFLHVMQCLFNPAIEKAGFKPILPVTQGSEIIHGEIISKIESSDLVLCDMSILNPNVFFELGIRTALNKPVCLIKDNIIEKVPFDTGIINYHVYSPDLSSWIVKNEIEKLALHISESFKKSNNYNSLWKYFGLKSVATPPEKLNGETEKIEYLTMQVDAIRKQLNKQPNITIFEPPREASYKFLGEGLQQEDKMRYLLKEVRELLSHYVVNPEDIGTEFVIDADGRITLHMFYGDKMGFTKIPTNAIYDLKCLSSTYGFQFEAEELKEYKR